jgi:vitamin B12 transporter
LRALLLVPMRLAAGLCLLLLAPSALAQPRRGAPDRPGVLADTVVVTASRAAESARLAGQRVTVITADVIARTPAASLDELLRTAAGVDVLSRGGFGVQSDLTIRGSTFGGVLLLLDGVRFNDPMTGHFLTDFPIPLAEIARVEVLRGPATALYGPDALGGVVHVITKTALGAAGVEAGITRGAHDYRASSLAFGSGGFGAGAEDARTNGEAVPVPAAVTPTGLVTAYDYDRDSDQRYSFNRRNLTGALRTRLGGLSTFVRYGFDDRAFSAVRFYSGFASDSAREATTTHWLQAAAARTQGRTGFDVRLGLRRHDDTYRFRPRAAANEHRSGQAALSASVRHALSDAVTLDAGALLIGRYVDSNNLGEHRDASGGVYAQARYARGPLAAAAAARVDHDPGYGTEVTPQLRVAYAAPRWGVHAGAGRAVRAPSYAERYFNSTLARPRGRDYGDPDLRAERAWSVEAGADVRPVPGLVLRATGFRRDTDGLIDFILLPADTVYRARNLLTVAVQGVEAEADALVGPARLALAYTFLDVATEGLPAGAQAKYVLSNARHSLQGTITLARGPLTAGLQALVRDPYDDPAGAPTPRTDRPYALVNVRAGFALDAFRVPLVVTAELRNVLDRRVAELYAPLPGRWWLVGVKMGR